MRDPFFRSSGNYVENVRSSSSPSITNNTYHSVDSGNVTFNDSNETGITLSPGDWDISGLIHFSGSGGLQFTQLIGFIGTAKGTSTAGALIYENYNIVNLSVTNGAHTIVVPTWRVRVETPTTYYLKARVLHNATGTCVAVGSIQARKMGDL